MFTHGSSEDFAVLYKRFRRPILKYVSARISDEQVAEEVTQEIFIKVFRFKDSYDKTREFSTWLWTIARNTVVDVLRRKRDENVTEDAIIELEATDGLLAESLLERRDLRRQLWKIMKRLTQVQRRVIWMCAIQQCTYAEIAAQLDLSVAAVKNLVYRVRLTLDVGEIALV